MHTQCPSWSSELGVILITYVQSLHADLENREVRLRAQEEEMKKRDAEINRLLGELRRCQTQLLEQQVQNDLMSFISKEPQLLNIIPSKARSSTQAQLEIVWLQWLIFVCLLKYLPSDIL